MSEHSDYDELVAETLATRPAVDAILTRKAQRARIASALRALRKRKGLSQRQLAARTGWAQAFVARLESIADEQMPSPETVVRYAEACGAKVGLVFLDREEGGKYCVGGAAALTDDAEAAAYLTGLGAEEVRGGGRLPAVYWTEGRTQLPTELLVGSAENLAEAMRIVAGARELAGAGRIDEITAAAREAREVAEKFAEAGIADAVAAAHELAGVGRIDEIAAALGAAEEQLAKARIATIAVAAFGAAEERKESEIEKLPERHSLRQLLRRIEAAAAAKERSAKRRRNSPPKP